MFILLACLLFLQIASLVEYKQEPPCFSKFFELMKKSLILLSKSQNHNHNHAAKMLLLTVPVLKLCNQPLRISLSILCQCLIPETDIKNITVFYNSKERTNLHVAFSLDLQNISWLLNEQELEEFCSQQI